MSVLLRISLIAMLAVVVGCGGDQTDKTTSPEKKKSEKKDQNLKTTVVSPRRVQTPGGVYTLSTDRIAAQEDELVKAYDPRQDGWDSEAFHEQTNKVLKTLTGLLSQTGGTRLDDRSLAAVISPEIKVTDLRPSELAVVFDDGVLAVRRPKQNAASKTHRGVEGFAEAAGELFAPWQGAGPVRVWLKQYRINHSDDGGRTTVIFSAVGATPRGRVQQNATWHCQWTLVADAPRLVAVEIRGYEEIVLKGASRPLFADCTEGVLGGAQCYSTQLARGSNYWLKRIPNFPVDCLQGVAVGDVNGDGLEDVFLCQGNGLPNRLFLARADGTAIDKSQEYGVDWLDSTRSALLVDLDNDGDQDMVVAMIELIVVLENEENARFTERWRMPAADGSSMAAADVDQDGILDVYIGSYQNQLHTVGILASPVPYHDANNGAANTMLRNDGQWGFVDVTKSWGLAENNSRFTLAMAFEDYDNDGDLDLYVTNDFGRNNLYRNIAAAGSAPGFKDVAAQAGVEDTSFGMSTAWADVNHDGLMDLYVSNMFSAAGNRVTYQRKYMKESSEANRSQMRYLSRGNSLFVNAGERGFIDVGAEAAVVNSQWAWASKFCDINNDGWADLLALNGFLSGPKQGDL